MLSVKIDTSYFEQKMNRLCNNLSKYVYNSMVATMEEAQTKALSNKIGSKDKDKIPFEVENTGTKIVGTLRTNMPLNGEYKSYAPMIEYGTGRLGELEKLGTTDTFKKSGYSYWYLPVEKAPRDFGANRIVKLYGKQYYIMYTQPPRPFMRPTAFYLKDNAKTIIANELKNEMRG